MQINEVIKHRRLLIPYIAKKIKAKTYLEIGVRGGKTFLPIRVRRKIAVDPVFKIKNEYRRSQTRKYLPNFFAKYFECTSDEFFLKEANRLFNKNTIDLAFIDGLHTAEQTYKDIANTLKYLSKDGIIVVHDCSPKSSSAAYPAKNIDEVKKIKPPGFDGMWSGDVWKMIPRIRRSFPDLFVFVIDHDSGLGIISKHDLFDGKVVAKQLGDSFNIKELVEASYDYLDKNRVEVLNIISDQDLINKCRLFS